MTMTPNATAKDTNNNLGKKNWINANNSHDAIHM